MHKHSTTTRPTKKDGTADRRFGARPAPEPRGAASFTLADYAISRQHVADLEDSGLICSLEQDHGTKPEAWSIVNRRRGSTLILWRAGDWTVVEHGSNVEFGGCTQFLTSRRRFRSLDTAWNHVRAMTGTSPATYAAEAANAAAITASLPAWLTTAQG